MSEIQSLNPTVTSPAWVESTARVVTVVALAAAGVFALAGGVTLASGQPPLNAVGIGLFSAVWGGPGFAAIIFGARYAASLDAHRSPPPVADERGEASEPSTRTMREVELS